MGNSSLMITGKGNQYSYILGQSGFAVDEYDHTSPFPDWMTAPEGSRANGVNPFTPYHVPTPESGQGGYAPTFLFVDGLPDTTAGATITERLPDNAPDPEISANPRKVTLSVSATETSPRSYTAKGRLRRPLSNLFFGHHERNGNVLNVRMQISGLTVPTFKGGNWCYLSESPAWSPDRIGWHHSSEISTNAFMRVKFEWSGIWDPGQCFEGGGRWITREIDILPPDDLPPGYLYNVFIDKYVVEDDRPCRIAIYENGILQYEGTPEEAPDLNDEPINENYRTPSWITNWTASWNKEPGQLYKFDPDWNGWIPGVTNVSPSWQPVEGQSILAAAKLSGTLQLTPLS